MMKNIIIWNLQYLNKAIADRRKLCNNKNYFNQNSTNGLLLVVFMIALMFPTHSSELEEESNKIRCLDIITCTKCTIEPMCVWSLKKQTCGNKNQLNSSSLIASRTGECPKFSVVTTYDYNDKTLLKVYHIIKITNDVVGFINYLKKSKNMYYVVQNYFQKTKITNETNILCRSYTPIETFDNNQTTHVFFMFIKFNDVMLRFNNVADHYVTVYKNEECVNYEKSKNCATCGWNTNGYLNYLEWCSSENTCVDHRNVYMKNNDTDELKENVAYVTNDCAEIIVMAVDPLSGPESGGTIMSITVRNHRILADNRILKVTVAGTVCANPRTSGLDTLICTTLQSVGIPYGPVLVEYSSTNTVLKVESSQIFQFCYNPVLDADQRLGGIVSGGTSVPVHGKHFVESCFAFLARLYVDFTAAVRVYADSYCDKPVNDTYMVCRSPSLKGAGWDGDALVVGQLLSFGLDVVKVTGNQSLHVVGKSHSYCVHPDPDLENFVIDQAGSIVINGLHLDNVRLEDIVIWFPNSSATGCRVTLVTSRRIVCDPIMNYAPVELHEILVKIGSLLPYTLANRSPTHIVDPFSLAVAEQLSTLPDSNKTSCSDLMTCTKCTFKTICIWSLQLQACENRTKINSSGLIITKVDECPRFSIVKEFKYDESSVSLKYIVKLSNDSNALINYLDDNIILYNRFPIHCNNPTRQVDTYNNTIIACEFYIKKSDFDYNHPSFTFFTFINFDDVMLQFDNVADHYATFYEKEECVNNEKYKSCATCGWKNGGYSNYLRWCSSNNTCQVRKNLYMMNNGKDQLNVKLAHLTNDCAEINVTAVDPLAGPETGGTTLMITVRNHRLLVDNRTLKVTVAGALCMNPETSGLETITCTTSQSVGTPTGPILVEYTSSEGVLKIESSQMFNYCLNPILAADQHLEGVVSGGTSVPVRGSHFVEPCFAFLARLYVDLTAGVREYADSYCDPPVNNTYMICRSPKVNSDGRGEDASIVGRPLNFGLEITLSKHNFSLNQSLPIVVHGPLLRYHVHPDPVLSDFVIDENCSVVVNGLHLQHLKPEDIVIRAIDSPSSVCIGVLVTRDSLLCEPTTSFNTSQGISVTLGESLVFTVFKRTLPHPDNVSKIPGWLIAVFVMFLVLIYFCALAYCLRKKHRDNVTENIRNTKPYSSSLELSEHTKMH